MEEKELFEVEAAAAETADNAEVTETAAADPEVNPDAGWEKPVPDPSKGKWYVLHTYSGYENIVQMNLEKLIEKHNLQSRIFDIRVPEEDVVEEKNGKRKVVKRRLFPCYVLVKMDYTNDMWHLITGTRGVTGFVGPKGYPLPLSDDEIRRMRLENIAVEINVAVGDKIKVVSGPLEGFIGDIEEIDAGNSKCRVTVSMFGRQTPVELELIQIEKL